MTLVTHVRAFTQFESTLLTWNTMENYYSQH